MYLRIVKPAKRARDPKGIVVSIIHAEPTKNFFINMITRDIGLSDCVYDLIDNSLDGAASEKRRLKSTGNDLSGYFANIKFGKNKFTISDNCGGIGIAKAEDYAFRFGKPADAPTDGPKSIGLYGIGMKRAIFKIGKIISIRSETFNESFRVNIDVDKWANKTEWEFDLVKKKVTKKPHTTIEITSILKEIANSFSDEAFFNGLCISVAKYYSIFLDRGFKISINGQNIKSYIYKFEVSKEIIPSNYIYTDDPTKIKVQIIAGIAARLANDASAETKQRNPENYGWYVVCNDRVVIAADKTSNTIWGRDFFTRWHSQYNGFMGIVKFSSKNASDLPWTTTKREIDQNSGVYRRAVIKMKEATQPVINYTSSRKDDKEGAEIIESKTTSIPIANLVRSYVTIIPTIRPKTSTTTRIQYDKNLDLVKKVAASLGRIRMSNKEVGATTFDYYVDNEIEE